jgi:hypothetical protein
MDEFKCKMISTTYHTPYGSTNNHDLISECNSAKTCLGNCRFSEKFIMEIKANELKRGWRKPLK